MKSQRSSSKPKKYKSNKFERISEKIFYFAFLLSILYAGWFIFFETANIVWIGMLRTLYPFCLILFLFPFDIRGQKYSFEPSKVIGKPYDKGVLKVFDSSFREDGFISTLFSKALIIGTSLGTLFFIGIGFIGILNIIFQ